MPTYRGPYSPDFDRDGVGSPISGPVNDAAFYPAAKSTLRNAAFKTTTDDGKSPISIADFVDPQPDRNPKYDKPVGYSGSGGFSGALPKSSSHPKAGLVYGKKTS